MISFDSFLIKPPFDGEMMGLCDVVPEKPVTVHTFAWLCIASLRSLRAHCSALHQAVAIGADGHLTRPPLKYYLKRRLD